MISLYSPTQSVNFADGRDDGLAYFLGIEGHFSTTPNKIMTTLALSATYVIFHFAFWFKLYITQST